MVGFVKGKKPDLSGLKKIADSRNKGRPPAAIGGKGGGVTKKPVGTGKPVGGMPKVSGSKGSVAPMPSTGSSARRPNPRVTRHGLSDGGSTKENEMMKKEGRGMAKADLQKHASMPASKAHAGLKKGGMAKLTKAEMPSKMGKVKTAKPSMGSASKRADGVAMKGKTKGTMLRKGGMCK